MGMMCMSHSKIVNLEIAYFLAYVIAGYTIFILPDRWGCYKTLAVFGSLHTLAQFTILLINNYTVRLIAMAVMGLC